MIGRAWSVVALTACVGLVAVAGMAAAQDSKAPPKTPPETATTGAPAPWGAQVNTEKSSTGGIELDAKQTELVKKVSSYFNTLANLKGNFVQTGADAKRMKGKFYVKRPGRFRFDYALPSKQIIISDGEYLAIQDLDLNNEDRYSLDQTPFRLLLRKEVDLLRDAQIVDAQEADQVIIVSLRDKDPDTPGTIKLFLVSQPALELKEWVTTDAQGQDTRVELSELVKSDEIDAAMFKINPVGLLRHP